MKKARTPACSLCGRELGGEYKKIILRQAANRGKCVQICTVGEADMCRACEERFLDFQERCRLSADE